MKNNCNLRLKRVLLSIFLWLLLAMSISARAQTVTTDKADYVPGEVVKITGTGWTVGETVTLVIKHQVYTSHPDQTINTVADGSGNLNDAFYTIAEWDLGESFLLTATSQSSNLFASTTFTDAGGSYTIKWYAADPEANRAPYLPTYPRVTPETLSCPVSGGRASNPLSNAVAYASPATSSNLDAVTSLAPKNMALCQIVPYFLEITVSGATTPENGIITINPEWLAKTTSGDDFGFNPAYGLYCAFVDFGENGTIDAGSNATVDYYNSTTLEPGTNNEKIYGTVQISGLDNGDKIFVELWVVLKCNIPVGSTGNVQTSLVNAHTGLYTENQTRDNAISTGNQTVPLLRVQEFFSADADVQVTKTSSPVCFGDNITYKINVTNNSTNTIANGIVVTDVLGPNQTYVSSSGVNNIIQSGQNVTFNVGFLIPGQSLDLTVVSNPTISGTVSNSVTVTAITNDPVTANNTASTNTSVAQTSVSVNDIGVCYGEDVTFTANISDGSGYSYVWSVNGTPQTPTSSNTLTLLDVTANAAISVTVIPPSGTTLCNATDNATLTVNPAISVSADDKSVCHGEDVTFTAIASGGTGAGYVYQWKVDNIIQGSTTNTLTLNDVTANANISVSVKDNFVPTAGATSCTATDGATLSVNPAISVSVDDQAVCHGENVTFTAIASGGTGTGYVYQWKVDNVIQASVTTSTLTLNTVTANANISVSVKDNFVPTAGATTCTATDGAALTVNPAISVSVDDQAVCYNEDVSFTAIAGGGTGTGYVYQWKVDNVIQASVTTSTLTLNTVTANANISVSVKDNFVPTAGATTCTATDGAALTVNPAISVRVDDQAVCQGENVTFTAIANGGTGTGYVYQWKVDDVIQTSVTGSTLTLSTVTAKATISVSVKDNFVPTAGATTCTATDGAALTVNPTISVSVDDQAVCQGENVTFTAIASGGTGTGYVYQWKVDDVVQASTTSTLTLSDVIAGASISVTVKDNFVTTNGTLTLKSAVIPQCTATDNATLTVNPAVSVSVDDRAVCYGQNVTFTAIPGGGTGAGYVYQWKVDDVIQTSVTGSTLTLNTVTANANISVSVKDNFVPTTGATTCTATDGAALTVNPAISVSVDDQAVCYNEDVSFNAIASGGTGTGYVYQWKVDDVIQASVTGSTLTLNTVTANAAISVSVKDNFVPTTGATTCTATDGAALTVNPAISVSVDDQAVCHGENVTFNAIASGGTGTGYVYQWKVDDVIQASVTGSTLTLNTVTANAAISVTVKDNFVTTNGTLTLKSAVIPQCTATDNATLTVNPAVSVSVDDRAVCYGQNVTFTAIPGGGTGAGYVYQWKVDDVIQASVTGSTLTLSTVTANANISVSVKDNFVPTAGATTCTATDGATLTVNPAISVSVDDQAVCYGENVTFTAIASGGTGAGYVYQWKVDDVIQASVTGSTLTLSTVTANANISVSVKDNFVPTAGATTCTATDGATLTVNPAISVSVDDQAVCYGENVTFTAIASGGTGTGYVYQWKVDDVIQASVTGSTLTLSTVTANANISVSVKDNFVSTAGATTCTATDGATLTVNPAISVSVDDQAVCYGEDVTFTAIANGGTGAGYVYQWKVDDVIQASVTGSTLTLNTVTAYANISVSVKDNFVPTAGATTCTATDGAALTVNPAISVSVDDQAVCHGENVTFTAIASGGTGAGYVYQWKVDNVIQASVTGSTLTLNTVTANANISVSVKDNFVPTAGATTCTATDGATLTVNPAISVSVDDQAVCYGEDVTFTAIASGGTGTGYVYQWKVDDVIQASVTGSTLTLNTVTANATISVSVKDNFVPTSGATTCTATDGAALTVNPTISVSVDDQAVCHGENVTFNAIASGGTGTGYVYQWKVDDVIQASVTGSTLTLNTVTANANISVSVKDNFVSTTGATTCTAINGATLTVNPAISVNVSDQTVCELEDVTFTANASGGTGTGYSYVWSVNGTLQSPTTSNTLTLNDVTANAAISVTVKDNFAPTAGATACSSSGNASLTVTPCSWISLKKTTNGVVNSALNWSFKLYEGAYPNLIELASQNTLGVTDGILFEDYGPLSVQKAYTVSEMGVPAGYGTKWYIDPKPGEIPDGVFDPIGYTFYPGTGGVYNYNASDQPPQDLGNRCYQINIGQLLANTYATRIPSLNASVLKFEVDNTFPGGDPRTPGYWKNWNTCTGGGQVNTATANATDKNGDGKITAYDRVNSGWALLDDIIELTPITWGTLVFGKGDCQKAQLILDNRDLAGTNRSSDPAYNLAKHLLAYQLNQGAGARICYEMTTVATEAVNLLVSIPFDGYGADLSKVNTATLKAKASRALELAKILDAYNNGVSCIDLAKMITPTLPTPPLASLSCSTSVSNVTTFGGTNGSITVTATGGNPGYQYRIGTSGTFQSSNVFGNLKAGTYTFTVKDANAITCSCTAMVTQPKKGTKSAEIATIVKPTTTYESTFRAYPNPFTDKLNIEFSSANDTQVKLEIYSITGARLEVLFNGTVNGGELYTVSYLPKLVSSQIVLYHLTMNGTTQIGKLIYNERR